LEADRRISEADLRTAEADRRVASADLRQLEYLVAEQNFRTHIGELQMLVENLTAQNQHLHQLIQDIRAENTRAAEEHVAAVRQQIGNLENQINQLEDVVNCVVCKVRAREALFAPCSHVVCCRECAVSPQLVLCPVRRVNIVRRGRVYVP